MPGPPRHLELLDGEVVRHRRTSAKLSVRALAGVLGVAPEVINRLEAGMRQNDLDVAFLVDLADKIGVTVEQLLLDRPRRCAATEDPDEIGDGDVREAGAVLAGAADWVQLDDLAEVLGWTIERALVAVDRLTELAPNLGLRMAWAGDREVRFCGDLDAEPEVQKVTAKSITVWGMQLSEAKILGRLATGGRDVRQRRGLHSGRRLAVAGLLRDDLKGLTDTAKFNLCLHELGLAPPTPRP